MGKNVYGIFGKSKFKFSTGEQTEWGDRVFLYLVSSEKKAKREIEKLKQWDEERNEKSKLKTITEYWYEKERIF